LSYCIDIYLSFQQFSLRDYQTENGSFADAAFDIYASGMPPGDRVYKCQSKANTLFALGAVSLCASEHFE